MSDAASIDKHVRAALMVFGALLVLTAVTVGIYYLHLGTLAAIALALFVATVKGSLVACYFMHLIDERKLVYWVLMLTAVFFVFLLLLPVATSHSDQVGV